MNAGVEVAGHDADLIRDWVRSVDPSAGFTLDPPIEDRSGRGVSVYLLEVTPRPPSRGAERPPHQLWLRYLVTTWAEEPEVAQQLLLDLAFAAMDQTDLEVATEPVPAATWTALGAVARPSFVLRASARRDRPETKAPPVLYPIRVDPGRILVAAGIVLDPREQGVADATIEVIGLDRTIRTDKRGRFRLTGVPGGRIPSRLRIRAKGTEVIVGVPADPDLARSMVIHLDPLEGEHGRTAHA